MNQRLDFLDSSRGLAALSVVLSHYFGAYGLLTFLEPFSDSSLHIFWHGEGAVTYFYVLSGYVLSVSYFKNIDTIENLNIQAYLVKRFFRIFPVFLFVLFASWLIQKSYITSIINISTFPFRSPWIMDFWMVKKSFYELCKEGILVLRIPSETTKRLLPQDWTLSTEFVISSIIPILVLLFNKGKFWILTMICFLALSYPIIFSFFIGMLIAFYIDKIILKAKSLKYSKIVLFSFGILLYMCTYNFLKDTFLLKYNNHTIRTSILESVGAGIFLIVILTSDNVKKILSNRLLVFLGKISYGIYAVHFCILIWLVPFLTNYLNILGMKGEDTIRISILVLFILVTSLFSFLIHILIEAPSILFGKKISNLIQINTK